MQCSCVLVGVRSKRESELGRRENEGGVVRRHSSLVARFCWWWCRRYSLVLLRTHADEGDGAVREPEGGQEGGREVPQNISGSKPLSGKKHNR